MFVYDTETCGLHGPTVLIQYALDDGPIMLHEVWRSPIQETLEVIEFLMEEGTIGYNLAFDQFHLCQTYTCLSAIVDRYGYTRLDENPRIEEYLSVEADARMGLCVKPTHALDLFLHARKGPYQSLMKRKPIKIRKVPTPLADLLAKELTYRIPLKDVYFEGFSDKKRRWTVRETDDPNFSTVVLEFKPKSGLKALAQDALGYDEVLYFDEISAPEPDELGYAPFAAALPRDAKGWPVMLPLHISLWAFNNMARQYAMDDVTYTRGLYNHFGKPKPDDIDSTLACMAGAVRWKGYSLDIERLRELRIRNQEIVSACPVAHSAPHRCRDYLAEVMDSEEASIIKETTKAQVLEEIAKWREAITCPRCGGVSCGFCDDGLVYDGELQPAAIRAGEILKARRAAKRIQLIDKFLQAGRFHASVNVIGTLSGRQSGADKLNAQGINRESDGIRSCVTFTDEPGYVLCGGDFDAFEISIADAAFNDPELHRLLLEGKKIHALFGESLFPGMTYDEIIATKGLPGDQDKYVRSKNGVFAMLYGGQAYTLVQRVGVTQEAAEAAFANWCSRFPEWARKRQSYANMFCSMSQPKGLGTRVRWSEPADYIESMLGFRRYFTLENQICKALYDLGENPPREWLKLKDRIVRRDREQSIGGAVRSAIFGAAFAIQGANMRAGANHEIQSTGAEVTKTLQTRVWDIQPAGISEWIVQPLNVHDEIMTPCRGDHVEELHQQVDNFVESMRPLIPLIGMDWKKGFRTWAEKG